MYLHNRLVWLESYPATKIQREMTLERDDGFSLFLLLLPLLIFEALFGASSGSCLCAV